MKLQNQTIKVHRNGYTFQIDPGNPFRRFIGGGGTDVETLDPYAGTGYRELYKKFTDWLQPSVGAVTPYPGQMVPGPSGLQQMGFDVAQGLTPIASGGQEFFGGMLGQADIGAPGRAMGMAETGLQGIMQPFDPSMVMEGLQPGKELALDTFFRDIVPGLKESYVSKAGTADTGALDRAMAREGGRLSLGLGAQAFPYLYGGQQAQLGRQQQGVGQAMNLAQLPGSVLGQAGQIGGMGTDMLSQMLNIGGMQRGITGEQMGEAAGKWQMQQPWASPWTNVLSTLQGAAPQMDYLSMGQGPGAAQFLPGLGSMVGGAEGGFLGGPGGTGGGGFLGDYSPTGSTGSDIQLAMQIAAMFSDARIKENVKSIDNALDKVAKLAGYSYNYTFNSPDNRNGGIMAQDLEEVLPDAVSEINGIKFVRYDAVVGLLVNAINELKEKMGA